MSLLCHHTGPHHGDHVDNDGDDDDHHNDNFVHHQELDIQTLLRSQVQERAQILLNQVCKIIGGIKSRGSVQNL